MSYDRNEVRRDIAEATGEPYNLGVSPTGPLPRGWHRVVWTDYKGRTRHLITDDISSASLAQVAIDHSELSTGSRFESWSDEENAGRQ